MTEVGEVARLQAGVRLLLQRKGRGDPVQHRECFHFRSGARWMPLQHGEEVFDQADSVWAYDRAGYGEARQPAVPTEYGAGLLPEGDEVGEPVAAWRVEFVLGADRVGHQVEEVLAGLDVAVQRGCAGAKLGAATTGIWPVSRSLA